MTVGSAGVDIGISTLLVRHGYEGVAVCRLVPRYVEVLDDDDGERSTAGLSSNHPPVVLDSVAAVFHLSYVALQVVLLLVAVLQWYPWRGGA